MTRKDYRMKIKVKTGTYHKFFDGYTFIFLMGILLGIICLVFQTDWDSNKLIHFAWGMGCLIGYIVGILCLVAFMTHLIIHISQVIEKRYLNDWVCFKICIGWEDKSLCIERANRKRQRRKERIQYKMNKFKGFLKEVKEVMRNLIKIEVEPKPWKK